MIYYSKNVYAEQFKYFLFHDNSIRLNFFSSDGSGDLLVNSFFKFVARYLNLFPIDVMNTNRLLVSTFKSLLD